MLKWEQRPYQPVWEADFCGGLLTLCADYKGWAIFDGAHMLCEGPAGNAYLAQKAAEAELSHRLRMAAETLDSSWLEAEREEEEEEEGLSCLYSCTTCGNKLSSEECALPVFKRPYRCVDCRGTTEPCETSVDETETSLPGKGPGFGVRGALLDKMKLNWSKHEFQLWANQAPLYHFTESGILADGKPLPGSRLDLASAVANMDLGAANLVRELLTTGETKPQNFSTGYDQILAAIKAEAEEVKL